jgi:hypothetical protein
MAWNSLWYLAGDGGDTVASTVLGAIDSESLAATIAPATMTGTIAETAISGTVTFEQLSTTIAPLPLAGDITE